MVVNQKRSLDNWTMGSIVKAWEINHLLKTVAFGLLSPKRLDWKEMHLNSSILFCNRSLGPKKIFLTLTKEAVRFLFLGSLKLSWPADVPSMA